MSENELNNKFLKQYLEGFSRANCETEVEELLLAVGSDLLIAPGSYRVDGGFAYEGGLLNKMVTFSELVVNINNALPKNKRLPEAKVIKTSLLALIGAYNIYTPEKSDWHIKQGIMYKFSTEKSLPLSIGERTIKLCNEFNVKLDVDEYCAILNLFKPETDKQSDLFNPLLGDILKSAHKLNNNINKK